MLVFRMLKNQQRTPSTTSIRDSQSRRVLRCSLAVCSAVVDFLARSCITASPTMSSPWQLHKCHLIVYQRESVLFDSPAPTLQSVDAGDF